MPTQNSWNNFQNCGLFTMKEIDFVLDAISAEYETNPLQSVAIETNNRVKIGETYCKVF